MSLQEDEKRFKTIANGLRKIQLKYHTKSCLKNKTDKEMINSYLTCSCCAEPLYSNENIDYIMTNSKNAKEFLANIEKFQDERM